jgi:hypothetical protein
MINKIAPTCVLCLVVKFPSRPIQYVNGFSSAEESRIPSSEITSKFLHFRHFRGDGGIEERTEESAPKRDLKISILELLN